MNIQWIETFRRGLEDAIRSLPEGFYDSFNFTTTGMNLCHPVTLGLLVKVVGELDGVGYVGVDVRLNAGDRVKFQPDIVAFQDAEALQNVRPLIFIDFESPNSCDARITTYHLRQYLEWVAKRQRGTPYAIVTSLPDGPARWQLRYTSDLNFKHKGNVKEIRDNPFRYWTGVWTNDMRMRPKLSDAFFLNINGRKVISFHLH